MVMNLRSISKLHLALMSVALSISLSISAQVTMLDRVVAIVDDDIVLNSELQQRMMTINEQIAQSGTQPPPQEIILQQVL